MTLEFPGVTLTCTAEFAHVQSDQPLFMLSPAAGGELIGQCVRTCMQEALA